MADLLTNTFCPKCGRALASDAPRGLCTRCLFAAMLSAAPPEALSSTVPGGLSLPHVFGGYELLAEVARGGMGIVYRARQKRLNRLVAVKVLGAGLFASADFVERFRNEAEAIASLDHPNIVPIYEVSECDALPFFSMKFVDGGSLAWKMENSTSPFSNREAAQLVAKLAHAVHYAHQHGILHRDIKPGNVLLDGQGEPYLTDFGLAKWMEKTSTLTRTVAMLGTPSYMSPEQARGESKQLTTGVDVYGLGAVLYELLTGQPPFAGGTTVETVRQVVDKPPRRPSALAPQTDSDLETIVLKCLEKNPARRYSSAEALALDLERWLRHEAILARPVGRMESALKWVRRRPWMAALSAITLLALTVSWVTLVRANWNIRAAETVAVAQRDLAQQRLYDSLVREARSIRTIRPLGFRRQILERIEQARALPNVRQDIDELRSEVAQCLGDAISFDPVSLVDPPAAFSDVALSHDGTLVAFGTEKGELVLHETAHGKGIARFAVGEMLSQLAFAPDGRSLFACVASRRNSPLDGADAVRLMEWQRTDNGAWSQHAEREFPNLRRLFPTTQGVLLGIEDQANREVRFVDAGTKRNVGALPLPAGQSFPTVIDLSPNGRLAAYIVNCGTNQGSACVEVWDLVAQGLRARLAPDLGFVHDLVFSPNSDFLACTLENGVMAFETSLFRSVNTWREFSPSRGIWCGDGTWFAFPLSQENGVRVCSVITGTEAARLTTQHQVADVRSSANGEVILVMPFAGPKLVIHLTCKPERLRLAGHVGGVASVEFSPDGETVASTGKDGMIRIWSSRTGKLLQTWQEQAARLPGQTISFSPDGAWIASGNYANDQVLVWAVAGEKRLLTLGEGKPGSSGTWSCGFSRDGRILVAAGEGIRGWVLHPHTDSVDGAEPQIEAQPLFSEPGAARNLQFHPSGDRIGYEGAITRAGRSLSGSFVRDLNSVDESRLIHAHRCAVQTLGAGMTSGTWLHRDADHNLIVTDSEPPHGLRQIRTLSLGESVSTYVGNIRVSPDGSKVALTNHNGRGVDIYELNTGRRLYSLPDDPGSIWWLAWHPNGRHLAVARGNGDISLWNLAEVEAVLAKVGLAP